MHHVFEITTTAFEGKAPRPDAINEMIGGDEMADWVRERLQSHGHQCTPIWPDDHGWDFHVENNGRRYLVVSSCDFAGENEAATIHIVQIAHQRSLLDKLLGRNKTPTPDPLLADLRAVLSDNPTFTLTADQQA